MDTIDKYIDNKIQEEIEKRSFQTVILKSVILLVVVFVLFHFVIGFAVVKGHSMVPAMRNNDVVLLNRLAVNLKSGDIVAIDMPGKDNYVKRIVGLPGDVIDIDDYSGKLIVNGKTQQESYIYEKTFSTPSEVVYPLTVGDDELFVMGDNREHSTDSRSFGCVKEEDIIGKVMLRIGFGQLTQTD